MASTNGSSGLSAIAAQTSRNQSALSRRRNFTRSHSGSRLAGRPLPAPPDPRPAGAGPPPASVGAVAHDLLLTVNEVAIAVELGRRGPGSSASSTGPAGVDTVAALLTSAVRSKVCSDTAGEQVVVDHPDAVDVVARGQHLVVDEFEEPQPQLLGGRFPVLVRGHREGRNCAASSRDPPGVRGPAEGPGRRRSGRRWSARKPAARPGWLIRGVEGGIPAQSPLGVAGRWIPMARRSPSRRGHPRRSGAIRTAP